MSRYFAVQDQKLETKQKVLQIAASLAAPIKDPYMQAVAAAADQAGMLRREVEIDLLPDGGATAKIEKTWYLLGDNAAMAKEGIELGVTGLALAQQLETGGNHMVFLAQKQPKRLLGIFAVDRPLTTLVGKILEELRSLNITGVLLTRQATRTAKSVANQMGIANVHSELPVGGKRKVLASLAEKENTLGVVAVPADMSEIPKQAFTILISRRSMMEASVRIESLEALPEAIRLAREVVEKVRRRFFWMTF